MSLWPASGQTRTPRPKHSTFDSTRRPSDHHFNEGGRNHTDFALALAVFSALENEKRLFESDARLPHRFILKRHIFKGKSPDQGEDAYRWAILSRSPEGALSFQRTTERPPARSPRRDPFLHRSFVTVAHDVRLCLRNSVPDKSNAPFVRPMLIVQIQYCGTIESSYRWE